MEAYVSFLKTHKLQQNHSSTRSAYIEAVDITTFDNEEELLLRVKFLWTLAFNLTTKEATSPLSSSILERMVTLLDNKFVLPISFWKRVCPHCLSFYHTSSYSVCDFDEITNDQIGQIIEMDNVIAKNAPNSLSSALINMDSHCVIFICGLCKGAASWKLFK